MLDVHFNLAGGLARRGDDSRLTVTLEQGRRGLLQWWRPLLSFSELSDGVPPG
jgi:hypothetical protein